MNGFCSSDRYEFLESNDKELRKKPAKVSDICKEKRKEDKNYRKKPQCKAKTSYNMIL